MSKKSRKRNKKILGLLGVLGAGLAMANRNKGVGADANDGFVDTEFKEQVVSTPKTIMDSMPARPKKIHYQKELKKIQMKSTQLKVETLV